MEGLLTNFFNLAVYQEVLPYLLQGLWSTIWLSLLVIPLGTVAGLGLALLSTQVRRRWVKIIITLYVDFFRSFPPLVLLIFIFFGTPFAGIDLPAVLAAVISFTLSSSSYYGEIFRAGIESVPPGQLEAAASTGLKRRQAFAYVLIPQAARNVLPDLLGNSIEIVKMTSLASVVAITELLRSARDAQALLYNPSPIVLAALIYLAVLWPLVRWLSRLEHKQITSQ
jgi:polar amino acid transport system permease protein